MDELEKEKMMVRGMKATGMTLVEIAKELGMSKDTVYTRYNEMYSPAKARKEKLSEEDELEKSIRKDEERIDKLKKENAEIDREIDEDVDYSPYMSDEEIVRKRIKKEKGQKESIEMELK